MRNFGIPNLVCSIVDFFNPATVPGAVVYAVVFLVLAVVGSRLVHLVVKRSTPQGWYNGICVKAEEPGILVSHHNK